jgi:hypothetical protein
LSPHKKLATLAAVIVCAALLPAAAQADPGDDWFRIQNDWDLSLAALNTSNGTRTMQSLPWPTNPTRQPQANQDWRKVSDSGLFRFRNANTPAQYALTVNSAVDWVNKPVNVYTDTPGDPDQIWRAIPIPGTQPVRYELKNPRSGKCLGSPGDAHEGNDQLYAIACNKNMKSQRWWFDNRG